MTQIFTLDLPPSMNRYWRKSENCIVVSAEAKAYRILAGWQAKSAGVEPINGPVGIEVNIFRARKAGDLDNYLKVLLDALQGVVYADDKQITALHAFRHDDPERPRVEICCWEASE